MRHRRLSIIESLERRALLSATAVADLYLSDVPDAGGTVRTSAALGSNLYFGYIDRPTSTSAAAELWTSDGTLAGTQLVKHFSANLSTSAPQPVSNMTLVNGRLYFTVSTDDYSGYFELWQTDGTANGTSLVKAFTSTDTY